MARGGISRGERLLSAVGDGNGYTYEQGGLIRKFVERDAQQNAWLNDVPVAHEGAHEVMATVCTVASRCGKHRPSGEAQAENVSISFPPRLGTVEQAPVLFGLFGALVVDSGKRGI